MNSPSKTEVYGLGISGVKLSDAVLSFLKRCEFRDLQRSTVKDHERKLGCFVNYCGDCGLCDVTTVMIREFLDGLKIERSLDVATVHRYLVSIKAFFRWLSEGGIIVRDPSVGIRVGGVVRKVVRGLSQQELERVLRFLEDGSSVMEVRHCAIVYLIVDCGLRISEVMNLKVSDVDWQTGVLKVRGKGAKERLARIGFGTRKILERYMVVRGRNVNSGSDWLWLNDEGGKCQKSVIQHWIKGFGRKIGMRLHTHLLRHTFAICFLRNGGDVFALQAALGHSSLEMTRRYCQALGFEDVFKAHELASPVDNLFKVGVCR